MVLRVGWQPPGHYEMIGREIVIRLQLSGKIFRKKDILMQPSKLSISELFQSREQYLIPLFQRGYVWTLTHQIQPLWEDIVDRLEALTEHRENAQKVGGAEKLKPLRKHFLGAIVIGSPVTFDTMVIPTREVIDGQQRISTLQIMLQALRDAIAPDKDDALGDDVNLLTFNKGNYRSEQDHLILLCHKRNRVAGRRGVD